MWNKKLVTVLLMTLLCCVDGTSMLSWIWGKSNDETTVLVADGVPLVSIPYESMTDDEKFLLEAAKFSEIQVSSPLGTCLHKVIMMIRTSCADISEEQLAKLSVNLLNCQSAVEGRKMFPCTEEMTLKQCTTEMDADMWNAYHLMSNRARAVCYASRSAQFRALTELTVNKLMNAAHSQIKTLDSLRQSQDKLEMRTVEAFDSLSEGNQALFKQQQHLKDAQTSAHNLVTSNLKELASERALIRLGHTQLATMTEDIKKKLEEASRSMAEQALERNDNHMELRESLMNIQNQAQLIWDEIETRADRIFEQHQEAIDRYEETLHKLSAINETIHYVWSVTNAMREEVDKKLSWLTEYIGDTGENMQRMHYTALHIIYLLAAMIVAVFLKAPFITRSTIILIVPLNLATYLKHGADACLDVRSMTALILLTTGMYYVMLGIQYVFAPKVKAAARFVTENGHRNGSINTQTAKTTAPPSVSLFTKLKNTIFMFFDAVVAQINRCKQICASIINRIISWIRQTVPQQEELSCSYLPSKKSREDVVYDYLKEFPSMSDDLTDFDASNLINDDHKSVSEYSLVDANDLRMRLKQFRDADSASSPSRRGTLNRSITPTRRLCNGYTRSGKKCRSLAIQDDEYCYRHTSGSSVIVE